MCECCLVWRLRLGDIAESVSQAASTSLADPVKEAFGFVKKGVSECACLAEVVDH